MRKASEMINEAQEIKLSKDWEISWSDWHAPIARDFLKKMDERASALNITKDMAENAVKAFWMGNFAKAVKIIWGNRVKSTKESANGGNKEVYTYIVKGYGVFTETYEYALNGFAHNIELHLDDEDANCYDLTHVFSCTCVRKGTGDFNTVIRQTESSAFKLRSNHILNCLFIGFSGRDLGMTLSGIKRKNKIQ